MATDRRTLLISSGLAAAGYGLSNLLGFSEELFSEDSPVEQVDPVVIPVQYLPSKDDFSALEKLIAADPKVADFFYCVAGLANHVVYKLSLPNLNPAVGQTVLSKAKSVVAADFKKQSFLRCIAESDTLSINDSLSEAKSLSKDGLAALENLGAIQQAIVLGSKFLEERVEVQGAFCNYKNAVTQLKGDVLVAGIKDVCPELYNGYVANPNAKVEAIQLLLTKELDKYSIERRHVAVRSDMTSALQEYACVTPLGEFSFSRKRSFRIEESVILRVNPYLLVDWHEDLFAQSGIWDLVHHEVYFGEDLEDLRDKKRGREKEQFVHIVRSITAGQNAEADLRKACACSVDESRNILLVGLDSVYRNGKSPKDLKSLKAEGGFGKRSADIWSPNNRRLVAQAEEAFNGTLGALENYNGYSENRNPKEKEKRRLDWMRSDFGRWSVIYGVSRPSSFRLFSLELPGQLRGDVSIDQILQHYYRRAFNSELGNGEEWHHWIDPEAKDEDECDLEFLFRGFEPEASGRIKSVLEIYRAKVNGRKFVFPVKRDLTKKEADQLELCPALYDILRVPLAFSYDADVLDVFPELTADGSGEIVQRLEKFVGDSELKPLSIKVPFSAVKSWAKCISDTVTQANANANAEAERHARRSQETRDRLHREQKEAERRNENMRGYGAWYEQQSKQKFIDSLPPLYRMSAEERRADAVVVRSLAAATFVAASRKSIPAAQPRANSKVDLPVFEREITDAKRLHAGDSTELKLGEYGRVVKEGVDKFDVAARKCFISGCDDSSLYKIMRGAEVWKQGIVGKASPFREAVGGLENISDAYDAGSALLPPKKGGAGFGFAKLAVDLSMSSMISTVAVMNDQVKRLHAIHGEANVRLLKSLNAKGVRTSFPEVNDLVSRLSNVEKAVTKSLENHSLHEAMRALEKQAKESPYSLSGYHAAGIIEPHRKDYDEQFSKRYDDEFKKLAGDVPKIFKGSSRQEGLLRKQAFLEGVGRLLSERGGIRETSWFERHGLSRVAEDLIGFAVPYKLGVVVFAFEKLDKPPSDFNRDLNLRLQSFDAITRRAISDTLKELEKSTR